MKNSKFQANLEERLKQNPVAKFAGRFNKAKVFDDKSKYSRKRKHAKEEVSPSVL